MTHAWSLRGRLFTGAFAWSLGLLVLAGMAMVFVMEHHRGVPGVVHGWLSHPLAAATAAACIVAGLVQVRRALSGLDGIRQQLSELHHGERQRVVGSFPAEVAPLVDDLNRLLDQRDQAVARALEAAGNLAHGLKTPLAVLAVDADRLAAAGQGELAALIRQQVDRMQRQVDHQLARARALSTRSGVARTVIGESAASLARTLARLHAGRDLSIDIDVASDLAVAVPRADVDEMLGNLLDNACRWSRTRVRVNAVRTADVVSATIDDDGPGIEANVRAEVVQRGVRADQSGTGSGLGLAIVRDLAELHGGSIALDRAPLGGLRAILSLPAARVGATVRSGTEHEPIDRGPTGR